MESYGKYQPQVHLTLEEYFRYNFDPGVVPMFMEICGLSRDSLNHEEAYWKEYVQYHIPKAYPAASVRSWWSRLARRADHRGSHSYSENILRDYRENGLPAPDRVYGWEYPP